MLPYFSTTPLAKLNNPKHFASSRATTHEDTIPWDQVTINKLNKKMVVQMTKMPQLMIQSNMSWCHDISTYIYPLILEDFCVFCSSSYRHALGKKMKKWKKNCSKYWHKIDIWPCKFADITSISWQFIHSAGWTQLPHCRIDSWQLVTNTRQLYIEHSRLPHGRARIWFDVQKCLFPLSSSGQTVKKFKTVIKLVHLHGILPGLIFY